MVLWAGLVMIARWLQNLRLIDSPEGASLQSVEFSLRGGLWPWLAVVLFLIGTALVIYFYRRESAKLSAGFRVILASLRILLIALLLLLLMRPVLLANFAGERPRGVILLLDASQSMTIADRRVSAVDWQRVAIVRGLDDAVEAERAGPVSRAQLVLAALDNDKLALLDRLRAKGPLNVMFFDRKVTPAPDDWRDSYRPEGTQTALADCLHEVLTRLANEPPAALVVLSDGRDTASTRTLDEVARACSDKGVALHIWGVGSTEAGVLAFKEVRVPKTIFLDDKPDQKDDPIEVPVRFRCRGYKSGTVELTLQVGEDRITETFALQEGENLTRTVKLIPRKGQDGQRPVTVSLRLREQPEVGDRYENVVQIKNARIKVLYVENSPRREYKFIQPALNRDRRLLLRIHLAQGDPRLAEQGTDPESGSMYVEKFPENFPEPDSKDPDRRPYDLVILGDVPAKVLGDRGLRALATWVKEGGGLVTIAGRYHLPSDYVNTPLAEALPVEFQREEFDVETLSKATPFRPELTYDGENSPALTLDDNPEVSKELWTKELWVNVPGFYWYYPLVDVRPGATVLLAHPEKKVGKRPDEKPLPLIATQFYGKGEVMYVGIEETWRWRDNTGDKFTARFWGQVAMQLGLPHLLGNARRSQLELERGEPILGRPGAVKGRFLDSNYEPITRSTVRAQLVNLDAKDDTSRRREVVMQRILGQPGEYRAALAHDQPGRHELRILPGDGLEETTLPFRVELPPRHELLELGLAEQALRGMAAIAGGHFYREEDLITLPDQVEKRIQPFTLRSERLLWGPLPFVLFVLLITAEWILRKFSNLS
ncbi:MAG: hypothetical protein SNJ82_04915 [Gemmataceae bacterium]